MPALKPPRAQPRTTIAAALLVPGDEVHDIRTGWHDRVRRTSRIRYGMSVDFNGGRTESFTVTEHVVITPRAPRVSVIPMPAPRVLTGW